jgi:hypothetical protein
LTIGLAGCPGESPEPTPSRLAGCPPAAHNECDAEVALPGTLVRAAYLQNQVTWPHCVVDQPLQAACFLYFPEMGGWGCPEARDLEHPGSQWHGPYSGTALPSSVFYFRVEAWFDQGDDLDEAIWSKAYFDAQTEQLVALDMALLDRTCCGSDGATLNFLWGDPYMYVCADD